jgi:hypothetical protein
MDPKSGHGHRVNRCAVVVCMAVVVGLAACGVEGGADTEESTAQPPAQSTASRAVLPTSETPVPVEPGTYQMPSDAWSVTDYSVTIPEGWTVTYGHIFSYRTNHPGEFGFYGVVVDEIFADACHGEEDPLKVGPGTDALIAALQRQPGPQASAPVQTTLGGHAATRIDLRIPKGMTPNCRMMGENLQVWYSEPADKYLVLIPDSVTSVYVLDLHGQRQVFLTQRRSTTSAEELAELHAVLDSLRIGN